MGYDHQAIEQRWQAYWADHQTFAVEIDRERPKFYVLDMFPYPSGNGLHVGHVEGYTATDIIARYKRMRGFNVLHPMGWDAFGLPAERYAMKTGRHPEQTTRDNCANFRKQLQRLGFCYDWSREINTTDPGYYKWTQWIFLQMWGHYYDRQAGRARPIEALPIPEEVRAAGTRAVAEYRDGRRLAYLQESPVNWCPDLRIVLANEEVAEIVDAGHEVVRKPMKQWMLRITEYAERLLSDLEGLDWPPHVLEIQRNWVGRSEGAEIDFAVEGHEDAGALTVFTTRPDTLHGATYMVLAPEHPLVERITTEAQREAVTAYVDQTLHRTERDRQSASIEGRKTGVDTGARALHPLTGAHLPIWIADYVLMGYGTGAIMAVPAHDERDHAFAKAMALPIVQVVAPADPAKAAAIDVQSEAFVDEGVAVSSPVIDGLPTPQAKTTMTGYLVTQNLGRARVTYKLRDWLFSRQRYWGEPFPLVHDADGTVRPLPTQDLPVELPPMADFDPSETGEPPLSKATDWVALPDGSRRETNTMPQWAGSCWYYLRFVDPRNSSLPWSKEAEDYWMPVDLYVGGVEHAATHLLYSRFWHKVLYDLGHVHEPEPFRRLVNQGIILGAVFMPSDGRRDAEGKKLTFLPDEVDVHEEDGQVRYTVKQTGEPVDIQWDKMSKSKGNVVNPDEVVATYGADSVRMYEMFMGPLEQSAPWQTEGLAGVHRFLARVHRLYFEEGKQAGDRVQAGGEGDRLRALAPGEGTPRQRKLLHKTIHEVTERIERMSFNTAIASMMVFVRDIVPRGADGGAEPLPRDAAEQFALLLAPFAPHLAEQLWSALGHERSLIDEPWPAADEALLREDTFTLVVQVDGKRRTEVSAPKDASRDELAALARATDEVQRFLEGREPKRVIVVPGRLVNFVG
ncbi:leucine--tRNA ligase [Paraliomyxa miuraensis]|uniref:leucine--tRNA ligase n=1 Tax=Paraliomyxa miuraensis TaxID=376150 RepID=UPI002251624B|nr:leucine--tRNA ligase [Paraliomyxa miuraensis]MCX4240971.1 leucine--tRNA ligase [Paraliomyxa miuraensis]